MYTSLIISVIVQIITGIVGIIALFFKVPAKFSLLKQMMGMEVFVQIVEGSFYAYWLYNFKNISNITPKRYFDWAITTPTMLLSLIFYLNFLNYQENSSTDKLEFFTLFNKEVYTIIPVLLLNWAMLLFGYLAEVSMIPLLLGVLCGFLPFLIYYYIIYKSYALTDVGIKIFYYFFFFWSLYGVAAVLPYNIKNMFYNILDLFAKNFFGIFLFIVLYTNKY
jgi:hypothetical protein